MSLLWIFNTFSIFLTSQVVGLVDWNKKRQTVSNITPMLSNFNGKEYEGKNSLIIAEPVVKHCCG